MNAKVMFMGYSHPTDPDTVMDGVKLKIGRARGMLDLLLGDVSRVLDTPSRGSATANPDGTFSSLFKPEEMPSPVWGALLGEVAHNLRSALDNLVSVLVLRNGERPSHSNAFPICLKPSAWRRDVAAGYPAGGPLANVSGADFELLQSLQPYQGIDVSRDFQGAKQHPLAVLTRVNNADKHAALHATAAYMVAIDPRVLKVVPDAQVEIVTSVPPFTPLQYGGEMTRYRFVGPAPENFVVFLNWPLAVQFTDLRGQSVAHSELAHIWDAVVYVVSHWDEEVRSDFHG